MAVVLAVIAAVTAVHARRSPAATETVVAASPAAGTPAAAPLRALGDVAHRLARLQLPTTTVVRVHAEVEAARAPATVPAAVAPPAPPRPLPTPAPVPAATTTTTAPHPAAPAPGPSGYGCSYALAYLDSHAAPGFSLYCPGNAEGHQAMTCIDVAGVCPGQKLIAIADPCPAAYMNEASNSWVMQGLRSGAIDPYGYCT